MAHKELITRMHDLIADTMECNDLLYAGLISDKMAALEAADKKLERIGEEASTLNWRSSCASRSVSACAESSRNLARRSWARASA